MVKRTYKPVKITGHTSTIYRYTGITTSVCTLMVGFTSATKKPIFIRLH